jgi:thiol-disulfide isomerase/thioredoxin
VTACAATPPTTTTPSPATTLPAIALATLDGRAARLDEIARGRPALVSLWATWCEACARELPSLRRLDEAARRAGATVIAVDIGEAPGDVAAFVRAQKLPWAQLVDERYALADALGARSLPATLVLDRDGRIVYRGGAFDAAALAALRATLPSGEMAAAEVVR